MDESGTAIPLVYDDTSMLLLVYQLERGETGNLHYQGYVEFTSRRSLSVAQRLLGASTAHLERRNGTRAQAIAYARKEDTRVAGPWVHGNLAETQGKRNDIQEFKAWFDAELRTFDDVIDTYPCMVARYPNFVTTLINRQRERRISRSEFVPYSGWQTELVEILNGPVSSRDVHWIYGRVGREGKSYFSLNWGDASLTNRGTYVITGGRHADIFFGYVGAGCPKVVFVDWARGSEDGSFPYRVLENFKNGYFLNSKYMSSSCRFDIPHLVVFSNFYPDTSQLSEDRWKIKEI